jgi:uncharacterized protein (DUF2236 family)
MRSKLHRMAPASTAWTLPAPLQQRVEGTIARLFEPQGRAAPDFSQPSGEPALMAADSVSWRVFKNPVTLFVGGVAAVVLELAEPRVRSGVWEHTTFRTQPLERLKRTAAATVMTVYGPRRQAEQMIERVTRLHETVRGVTPRGVPYAATDTVLLDWVQATAVFGFMQARHVFVAPFAASERDRCYAEGQTAARLYGATGAPDSQAALDALFERMRPELEASPIVHEFLHIVARMPALAPPLRPVQRVLVNAAIELVPAWLRERLGLPARPLPPWQRAMVMALAQRADRLMLRSSAWVQSCRRLGLPEDYLYQPEPATDLARARGA